MKINGFYFLISYVKDEICKIDNHSRSSLTYTLRHLEFISKNGIDEYKKKFLS